MTMMLRVGTPLRDPLHSYSNANTALAHGLAVSVSGLVKCDIEGRLPSELLYV